MNIGRSHRRISFLAFAALLAASLPLAAQQSSQTTAATAPLPTYDVVSIHENKSGSGGTGLRNSDDGCHATNITVELLIASAYNIRPDLPGLIRGLPGWASSIHFDINAKATDLDSDALKKLPRKQRQAMLVALLADRFHLRAHIETKILPVYDLVIAKNGSKLKEPAPTTATSKRAGTAFIGFSRLTANAITTENLASYLSNRVGRSVTDKTGLTGKYDINLKWTPEDAALADNDSGDDAPDIFTALQEQLGLKLVPSKGPVQTIVIDHVEMPSEN